MISAHSTKFSSLLPVVITVVLIGQAPSHAQVSYKSPQDPFESQYSPGNPSPQEPMARSAPPRPDIRYLDEYRRFIVDENSPLENRVYVCSMIGSLGPQAKSAVPELLKVFVYRGSPWKVNTSSEIPTITDDGLDFGDIAKNVGTDLRRCALWALQRVGADPRLVIPQLIECLRDMEADSVDPWGGSSDRATDDFYAHTTVEYEDTSVDARLRSFLNEMTKFQILAQEVFNALGAYGSASRDAIPTLVDIAKRQVVSSSTPIPGLDPQTQKVQKLTWVDVRCQIAAIQLLGALVVANDTDAVSGLRSIAAFDDSPEVRDAAERALTQISHRGNLPANSQ